MAQRRERPAQQHGGKSFDVRLSDGRTISVPVDKPRGPATSDVCCFCGEAIDALGSEHVSIGVRWFEEGDERSQSWAAHHTCLAELMHERVRGTGPFFAA